MIMRIFQFHLHKNNVKIVFNFFGFRRDIYNNARIYANKHYFIKSYIFIYLFELRFDRRCKTAKVNKS